MPKATRAILEKALRTHPLLSNCLAPGEEGDELLVDLLNALLPTTRRRNACVIVEGNLGRSLYFVGSGERALLLLCFNNRRTSDHFYSTQTPRQVSANRTPTRAFWVVWQGGRAAARQLVGTPVVDEHR